MGLSINDITLLGGEVTSQQHIKFKIFLKLYDVIFMGGLTFVTLRDQGTIKNRVTSFMDPLLLSN